MEKVAFSANIQGCPADIGLPLEILLYFCYNNTGHYICPYSGSNYRRDVYMVRKKGVYKLAKEQFRELCEFYSKLGYSKKQVKKLSEHCFDCDVKPVGDGRYSPDWTFIAEYEHDEPLDGSGMTAAVCGAPAPVGMAPMAMSAMAAPRGKAMPAPGMAMPLMANSVPADEFNSAETKNPRENEPNSPLDSPQVIFSANVNTGSWSYLRNMIRLGRRIDSSFVRIEEILNSYPYELALPGREELFSVTTEYSYCPWDKEKDLLLVEMKARKADVSVHQNLVLLIDVSGSMSDNWMLVQMSAAAIMSGLKKGDTLSIISYSDDTKTVVKQIDCGNKDKCIDALLSVVGIGGCTNGSDGLENAYKYLAETYDKNANNRIFIFTDGDFNFGVTSEGGLSDFIRKKRETGIYLSIVGYGRDNFKDNKMEALAMNGNGNYTFVSNPADILDSLSEKLVSNLFTVAKDVKISVELNPAYVSEYRLIGYDARQLTQKEFNDTEKAVDGIGSEHNVVALISLKRGEAKQQYSSRYVTAKPEDNKDEFAFIEVHYKSPAGEDLVYTKAVTTDDINKGKKDNISAASMLAMFGLLVKESEYKGDASPELLSAMLEDLDKNGKISKNEPYGHYGIIREYLKDTVPGNKM